MTDLADCPICKQPQPGHHMLDCHFKHMGRERMVSAFIPAVRLSPDSSYYICTKCKLEWAGGETPPCDKCQKMWRLIDANTKA